MSGSRPLRYAELFAGAGGLSLGLDRAGFSCAWHSEIAEFPRRVLKHRWPDTPLYGDVATLNGFELVERHGPIDLLSGGSPCQDLSVAGKRKGMTEGSGTRSSLFYEQLRLWNETGAEFLLWENVDGARSSNDGKDFGSVLSAIVGAAVFVPTDGWRSGGVAVGPKAIAAWRVLDAQFFGVPQRRRRVFVLCSRTGRADPAEILSLSEGLRGDTAPSGEAWEGIAGGARVGTPGQSSIGFQESQSGFRNVDTFATIDGNYGSRRHNGVISRERPEAASGVKLFAIAHGEASERRIASCIPANSGPNRHGEGSHSATQFDAVLSFAQNQRGELRMSDVSTSLNQGGGKPGEGYPAVFAFKSGQSQAAGGTFVTENYAPTLQGQSNGSTAVPAVLAFENHAQDSRFNRLDDVFPAISGQAGTGGNNLPLIVHSLRADGFDASEDGTGRGTPIVVSETGKGFWSEGFGPLRAEPGGMPSHIVAPAFTQVHGIPRRLMPIECERLMGWPDNWTNVPDDRGKPASDANRYKACGNGVVSNCVQWIGERLVRAVA